VDAVQRQRLSIAAGEVFALHSREAGLRRRPRSERYQGAEEDQGFHV